MEYKKTFMELTSLEENLRRITEEYSSEADVDTLKEALGAIQTVRVHIIENSVKEAINQLNVPFKEIASSDSNAFKQNIDNRERRISLDQAVKLIELIQREAARMGVNAVVAVADKGARPIAVHAMEDSHIASYDIALNKAYTSASLKISTAKLKTLCQPGGELYGIQNTNEGKIVIFGGGEPLFDKGILLGGLGVSGGTESQDVALAAYGKEKSKEAFSWI